MLLRGGRNANNLGCDRFLEDAVLGRKLLRDAVFRSGLLAWFGGLELGRHDFNVIVKLLCALLLWNAPQHDLFFISVTFGKLDEMAIAIDDAVDFNVEPKGKLEGKKMPA